MSTTTFAPISVEEYLRSAYEPDCDYVDGHLEERNLGERDHSRLQGLIYIALFGQENRAGVLVYPEQRIRIADRRYRIPDICVMAGPKPDERVFTKAPHLCVEILSPEDTMTRVLVRLRDYAKMGVPNIWVFDPEEKTSYTFINGGLLSAGDVLKTDLIELPIKEIFAQL